MGLLTGDFNRGYCPICQCAAIFIKHDQWLREHYKCIRCGSIPRFRAIIHVLETFFPNWRDLRIHESSPCGSSSEKLVRECKNYLGTHFFKDIRIGATKNGYRCEDLENQTFGDCEFDLVITQDVFEHLLHPDRAFAEIARTLRPGGAHVFTVPWYYWERTLIRAVEENGLIKYIEEPDYHGNPIDEGGSLVIREWGWDLCDYIYRYTNSSTSVIRMRDKNLGIDAEFIEVFITRKEGEYRPPSEQTWQTASDRLEKSL